MGSTDEDVIAGTGVAEGLGSLADPKHEAFAQHASCGMDATEACRKVYKCRAATALTKGPALLAEPTIADRIAALQRHASRIAEQRTSFGKAQLIAFLVETIQTPVSGVDQDHRQCQEWTRDELSAGGRRAKPAAEQKTPSKSATRLKGRGKTGVADAEPEAPDQRAGEAETSAATTASILLRTKTKMPGKLDAAKLLATLCGWNAPTKLEGKVNLGISPTVEEALTKLLG